MYRNAVLAVTIGAVGLPASPLSTTDPRSDFAY